jgi:hypothetical protein
VKNCSALGGASGGRFAMGSIIEYYAMKTNGWVDVWVHHSCAQQEVETRDHVCFLVVSPAGEEHLLGTREDMQAARKRNSPLAGIVEVRGAEVRNWTLLNTGTDRQRLRKRTTWELMPWPRDAEYDHELLMQFVASLLLDRAQYRRPESYRQHVRRTALNPRQRTAAGRLSPHPPGLCQCTEIRSRFVCRKVSHV